MMGIIAPTKSRNGKLITKECTARNTVEHDSTGILAAATLQEVDALRRVLTALRWVTLYLAPTIDDDVHLLEAVAATAVAVMMETIP